MAYDICPNCGQPTKQDTKFCANCGAWLGTDNLPVNNTDNDSATTVSSLDKRSKTPYIVLAIILAIVIAATPLLFVSYKKSIFKKNLRFALVEISNGAIKTEQLGNQVISVWYNSIRQVSDETTDPFTKTNGRFNDNFNTSLDKLYEDTEFNNGLNEIRSNQQSVLNYMQKLNNPPVSCAEAYSQIKTVYQDYLIFTQMVISPNGSYATYTDTFKNTDSKLANEIQTVLIYLE